MKLGGPWVPSKPTKEEHRTSKAHTHTHSANFDPGLTGLLNFQWIKSNSPLNTKKLKS